MDVAAPPQQELLHGAAGAGAERAGSDGSETNALGARECRVARGAVPLSPSFRITLLLLPELAAQLAPWPAFMWL